MSEILYLSTGDKRLDDLISSNGKGFRYTHENTIRILIRGNPGTGKSSLCCQIAIKFIQDNFKDNFYPGVLYYTLDEAIATVANRIAHFKLDTINQFLFHNDLNEIKSTKANQTKFKTKHIFISQMHSEVNKIFEISKKLINDQKMIDLILLAS